MANKPARWWQRLHDTFFPHARNGGRPHFFAPTTIVAFVLALVAFEGAYLATLRFVLPSESFLASVLPAALLDLTNQDRVAAGDKTVVENPELDQAANLAAQDMAEKGYFAHNSPTGTTPWDWLDQVGYKYLYAGENLAVNFSDSNAVESAWMASPTHHANIVKPQYTEVGFGTAEGMYEGQETTFVVTFFGTPVPATTSAPIAAVVPSAPAKPAPPVATSKSAPVLALATSEPASSTVLGASAVAPALPPASASVFTLALASPVSTATAAAAAAIALIAALVAIGVIMRRRIPHAHVLAGGMALIVLAGFAILFDHAVAGQVVLPADTQSASAVSALAP